MLSPSLRFRFRAASLVSFSRANSGDPLADRNLELPLGPGRVVEIGKGDARETLADRFFDRSQIVLLVGCHERERITDRFGARGPTDAMDVVVRSLRDIEVHNMAERFDVDSAGGDVRRNENPVLAVLESGQSGGALRLRPVAVNSLRFHPALHQLLGQSVRAVLGACEHEGLRYIVTLQQRQQKRRL